MRLEQHGNSLVITANANVSNTDITAVKMCLMCH